MSRDELVKRARALGVPGAVSKMSKNELAEAIAKRHRYLATPAADIPKKADQ